MVKWKNMCSMVEQSGRLKSGTRINNSVISIPISLLTIPFHLYLDFDGRQIVDQELLFLTSVPLAVIRIIHR